MPDYTIFNPEEILKPMGIKGIHPAANIFPMMDQESFTALCESMQEYGLEQEVVLTHDGYLIDGRHRMMACYLTGVELVYVQLNEIYSTGYISYALRNNYHRRQINQSQKAIIALEVEKLYAIEAKERQRQSGIDTHKKRSQDPYSIDQMEFNQDLEKTRNKTSIQRAAEEMGVSTEYIRLVKKIKDSNPDMIQDILKGKINLSQAKKIMNEKEKDIKERVDEIERWKKENNSRTKRNFDKLEIIKQMILELSQDEKEDIHIFLSDNIK